MLLAIGLVALLPRLMDRVGRQYREAVEEPMVDAANIFAALIEQHVDESGALDLATIRRAFEAARARTFSAKIYNLTKTSISTGLYVTDRDGMVVFDSNGGAAEGQDYRKRRDVQLTLAGEYGARATRSNPEDERTSVMFVAAPIRHRDEIIGVVSVSKPTQSVYSFIEETRAWIGWVALAVFALIALSAALMIRVLSRPVRHLTAYALSVARGERAAPPRIAPPEVATLGHAFEEMRDALENRRYVETYVQTLTHEMKSPLAAIRGAAELLREEVPAAQRAKFLDNVQAESDRLQNIIDRLLALSEIERRKALERPEPVALGELASRVAAHLRPAAEARGLTVAVETRETPIVHGEPFLLEIALTNLLQNAIDFSPRGGQVRLEVRGADGCAELIVEDDGTGIPAFALPRVFERFYSLQHPATGRKSSGLGLCFVCEAAELHGGSATVENRTDRSGVRATLRLPAKGR